MIKRRLFSFAKEAFIMLLILAVCIEIVSAILIFTRMVPERYPSYRFRNIIDHFHEHHEIFGVWHKPNSRYKRDMMSKEIYEANSYGAADKERSRRNQGTSPRLLILGDSFVEGRGVSPVDRYTNLTEAQLGLELLNFGSAGYFGTTQYYLVYKHLAKQFDHDFLVVGILPDNDFLDNDLDYGKQVYHYNYRPYFVGDYPDYELIYYDKDFSFSKFRKEEQIKAVFREFTFSYTALKYLVRQSLYAVKAKQNSAVPTDKLKAQKRLYSGYYDFSDEQFQLMAFTLEKIKAEAGDIPMVILTYPSIHDLNAYQQLGPSPLAKQLQALADRLGIGYLDALPHFYAHTDNWGSYYLFGDGGGHWTPYGNQVMADYLLPFLQDELAKHGLIQPDEQADVTP